MSRVWEKIGERWGTGWDARGVSWEGTKEKYRFNMAAREESLLSRDVNKTLNEGKLACQNRSCTVNNIFVATSEYPAANFRVKLSDNYLL